MFPCHRVTNHLPYQDAILKMQYAADVRNRSGQPFFLVTGIKRPHLNWRAPASYLDYYPIENVSAPTQLTLDKSIDPVAYSVFPMVAPNGTQGADKNFVTDPYSHGSDTQLRTLRQVARTTTQELLSVY